jgi:hypothetical protein
MVRVHVHGDGTGWMVRMRVYGAGWVVRVNAMVLALGDSGW